MMIYNFVKIVSENITEARNYMLVRGLVTNHNRYTESKLIFVLSNKTSDVSPHSKI